MKVLFLDIDGVLNSQFYLSSDDWKEKHDRLHREKKSVAEGMLSPTLCQELNRILLAVPDLMIVVSSSWRVGRSIPMLRNLLAVEGVISDRVIDKTGCRNDGHRAAEIREWLTGHPEVKDYAILDDNTIAEGSTHTDMDSHFYKTSWHWGLTPKIANKVIEHFSE